MSVYGIAELLIIFSPDEATFHSKTRRTDPLFIIAEIVLRTRKTTSKIRINRRCMCVGLSSTPSVRYIPYGAVTAASCAKSHPSCLPITFGRVRSTSTSNIHFNPGPRCLLLCAGSPIGRKILRQPVCSGPVCCSRMLQFWVKMQGTDPIGTAFVQWYTTVRDCLRRF